MTDPTQTSSSSGQQEQAKLPIRQEEVQKELRDLLERACVLASGLSDGSSQQVVEKLQAASELLQPRSKSIRKAGLRRLARLEELTREGEQGPAAPSPSFGAARDATRPGTAAETRKLDKAQETRQDLARPGDTVSPHRRADQDTQEALQAIQLEEINQTLSEVQELQEAVVKRVQQLLNGLVGRRGEDADANKQIASAVYDLARTNGVNLISKERPAYLRWSKGVFLAVTTDSSRELLDSSAGFPSLLARGKGTEKEAALIPDAAAVQAKEVQPAKAEEKGQPFRR